MVLDATLRSATSDFTKSRKLKCETGSDLTRWQKSDHLVVALKSGNADTALGVANIHFSELKHARHEWSNLYGNAKQERQGFSSDGCLRSRMC